MSLCRLVVGVGNGLCYRNTRHSLGLWVVEQIVALDIQSQWQFWPSLGGWLARVSYQNRETMVLWPILPYNLVGICVSRACIRFNISPGEVTVVHDDLEVSSGTLTFKQGGSAKGNNGVKSIIRALGSADFRRLRVGIGRPISKAPSEVVQYVMSSGISDQSAFKSSSTFVGVLNDLLSKAK